MRSPTRETRARWSRCSAVRRSACPTPSCWRIRCRRAAASRWRLGGERRASRGIARSCGRGALRRALRALIDLRDAVIASPLADLVAEVIERTALLPYFALQHRGEQQWRICTRRSTWRAGSRRRGGGTCSPSCGGWLVFWKRSPRKAIRRISRARAMPAVTTVHRAKGWSTRSSCSAASSAVRRRTSSASPAPRGRRHRAP